MSTSKKKKASGVMANGLATHAHAAALAAAPAPPTTTPPNAVRSPALKKAAPKRAKGQAKLETVPVAKAPKAPAPPPPVKAAAPAKKAAPKKKKKAASKKQPKTMRSATPAAAPTAVQPRDKVLVKEADGSSYVATAEALPPMPPLPQGPTISGGEEDFLVEVNNVMSVIRAGLTALPEPEDQVQRLQALYFGFLNTTVQLALDLDVPVERALEDMAECITRAEYVRASEAEYQAIEQQQQQYEQQQYQGP